MKANEKVKSKSRIMNYLLLLAVVFALALPISAEICSAAGDTYTVSVATGYLALRTAKSYDASNEIAELYTGDTVQVMDYSDPTYWYVYSPKHNKYGYVNKDYLIGSSSASSSAATYTVRVDTGYLALRTAKSYDAANEIGELYTGDTVQVIDSSDSGYWYVYSPKHNKYGYVNKNYLYASSGRSSSSSTTYTVSVAKGYLALRTAMAYDAANEIGELYTGDTVEVIDYTSSSYWYVYSPKHNKYGYVNKDYLVGASSSSNWTVSVSKGYLALRTAKSYDSANEIGELYTGDTVQVLDTSDSTYWYVYSPKHNKYGYVNKDYLVNSGTSRSSSSSGTSYTVSVATGYLALRNAMAYDASNEIGELYTGDTVIVYDTSNSTYWYVYSPKHNKYGYVNKDYLVGTSSSNWTVRVSKGYLALRTAKSYDESNEIGELYTGDTVQVIDATDSDYWYVYSPKHNKYGYVNKDYLY